MSAAERSLRGRLPLVAERSGRKQGAIRQQLGGDQCAVLLGMAK